jgi:hypothetical protein
MDFVILDELAICPAVSGVNENRAEAGWRLHAALGAGLLSSSPQKKKKGRLASGDPSSTCSSSTFSGRLLDFCTGGLSPSRIQLGNLC